MVVEGTLTGSPPWMADWRAGFWPSPAWITFPISTSSGWMSSGIPERPMASWMVMAPSLGAATPESPPPIVPTAVRTALTITASLMIPIPLGFPWSPIVF